MKFRDAYRFVVLLVVFMLFFPAGNAVAQISSGEGAANTSAGALKRSVFDFNGDKRPDSFSVDVVYSASQTVSGKVLITSFDGTVIRTLFSPHASDMFGVSVVSLGNIDGVAGDEIAVSAPLGYDFENRSGAVYVYSYGSDEPIFVFERESEGVFGVGLGYKRCVLDDGSSHGELIVLSDPIHDMSEYSASEDVYYTWKSFRMDDGTQVGSGSVTDFSEEFDWGDTWTFRAGIWGDINVDGVVDYADIVVLESLLGEVSSQSGIVLRGDLNGDGAVDVEDVALLSQSLLGNLESSSVAGSAQGLPWKKIIKKAKGVGKTVGFFALVRAGACIAAIDAVVIACDLYTNTDEEYVGCICLTLDDPGRPMELFCRAAFLGYDLLQAIRDYIGCGGIF